jgi:hypothetical protein
VGLERGLRSLASTTEKLLGRKSSGSALESREYGRRNPPRADHATLFYPQKLALTSLTNGCCSVGIVRSRTKATELLVIMVTSNQLSFFITEDFAPAEDMTRRGCEYSLGRDT